MVFPPAFHLCLGRWEKSVCTHSGVQRGHKSRPGNFTCFLLTSDPFTKLQCSENLSGNLPEFSSAHSRPCITSFLYPQNYHKTQVFNEMFIKYSFQSGICTSTWKMHHTLKFRNVDKVVIPEQVSFGKACLRTRLAAL